MSNTPLTDRAEYSMYGSGLLVDADFARELEIQLSAANAKIVELQGRLIAQENNKQINEMLEIIEAAAFMAGKNWLYVQIALVEYLARGRGENVKWLLSEYAKFKGSEK